MDVPSCLGFGLQTQQQQHEQVSLEAALAFIQDCDLDSGDEDGDANDSVEIHSLDVTGRHPPSQHRHDNNSFQQLLFQGHTAMGFPPHATAAVFGQVADEGGSSPLLHGSSSGTSDDEQMQVTPAHHSSTTSGTTTTAPAERAGKARATAISSPARAAGRKKAASALRGTELDKRFRGRRKEELLYLREKLGEFQTQLNQLKTEARTRSAAEGGGINSDGSPGVNTQGGESDERHSPSMWEMLATRQSEERQKVEAMNTKLRAALEKQIRMAKSLEKILRKRTSASLLHSSSPASKRARQQPLQDGSEDSRAGDGIADANQADEDFVEMCEGMEELYRALDDSVFEAVRQERNLDAAVPILESNVKFDDANGTFVESLDSRAVPLEDQVVTRVRWRFLSEQGTKSHAYRHEQVDVTEHTIVRSYVVELQEAGNVVAISGKQIVRRFEEERRCVIVWRSLFKPLRESEREAAGVETTRMALRESGWCVISSAASVFLGPRPTKIQSCSRISPALSKGTMEQSCTVGALTDFIVSSRDESIRASHLALENLLLAESVKA
ncbi:hypothetical protein Gpo141_00003744 [Globisporangium polare]